MRTPLDRAHRASYRPVVISAAPGRTVRGLALTVLLLAAPALAGCSDGASYYRVAYCPGDLVDVPDGGTVDVEFRQGATVVASGALAQDEVLLARVPVGDTATDTDIYVDGDEVGSAGSGDPEGQVDDPEGYVYLSSPGCPADPDA